MYYYSPVTNAGSGGVFEMRGYGGLVATVANAGGGGGGPYTVGALKALGHPCLSSDEISCVDEIVTVFG